MKSPNAPSPIELVRPSVQLLTASRMTGPSLWHDHPWTRRASTKRLRQGCACPVAQAFPAGLGRWPLGRSATPADSYRADASYVLGQAWVILAQPPDSVGTQGPE